MTPIAATATRQSPTAVNDSKGVVLIVDDDRVTLTILDCFISQKGHEVVTARDGRDALDIIKLRGTEIDVIILDYEMPVMNGNELMRRLQQDTALSRIPVILQTGHDNPNKVHEAIESGYFYYLTKPVNEALLDSVLAAALRESQSRKGLTQELSRQQEVLRLIETCRFRLRTLNEAEGLAILIAGTFPDPVRAVGGLAELMINAVEHGNLEIGFDEKTKLLNSGIWRDEVMRRADMSEHKNKFVEVVLQRKAQGVFVQITDQGKGFDWASFMAINSSRAGSSHGRGIARASAQSFDDLRFNEAGNQVTVVAYYNNELKEALEW